MQIPTNLAILQQMERVIMYTKNYVCFLYYFKRTFARSRVLLSSCSTMIFPCFLKHRQSVHLFQLTFHGDEEVYIFLLKAGIDDSANVVFNIHVFIWNFLFTRNLNVP